MNIVLAAQLDRGQVRVSPIAGCDPERDEKFDGYGQLSQSGSYEQLMQLRQQSATSNLIGANILEALDEGNRAKPWVSDGGGAAGGAGGGECVFAGEH